MDKARDMAVIRHVHFTLGDGGAIQISQGHIQGGLCPFVEDGYPSAKTRGHLTNESVFELEELPESLIVLGGRYIALETAQLFSRLGSQVTILQRSPHILPTETTDLTDALTGYLSEEGIQVVTGVSIERVDRDHGDVVVQATVSGTPQTFQAAHILVATGRKPNTDEMGLEDLGVDLDSRGFLEVDQTLQTSVEGIYGAGDIIGEPMYVYTAAYEGALLAKNAITGEATTRDYTALPWVIFTDPQVAGVGMDEQQAAQEGIEVDIAKSFPSPNSPALWLPVTPVDSSSSSVTVPQTNSLEGESWLRKARNSSWKSAWPSSSASPSRSSLPHSTLI